MSKSTFIAPFAVAQSTRSVDAQTKFFKSIEYVVDEDYGAVEDVPDEWFTARGMRKSDLAKTVALRLPHDPYMHLILYEWKNPKTTPGWPAPFNQIGSRGHAFLVGDVRAELARIKKDFPDIKVLHEPLTVRRKWGQSTSVLFQDYEGVFFELIEFEKGTVFDPATAKPAPPGARVWLHYQSNAVDFAKMSKFYEAFDLENDDGVSFRPENPFPFGFDFFVDQMKTAFPEYDLSGGAEGLEVGFYRRKTDCSQMHYEVLGYPPSIKLITPDPAKPTWAQRGIVRYCIKTKDYAGALAKARKDGHKIVIDDQRGCLKWGDSQWFFFRDTDGNLITLEEWFPTREWGERY